MRREKILAYCDAEPGPVGDFDQPIMHRERLLDQIVQQRVGAQRILDDKPGG